MFVDVSEVSGGTGFEEGGPSAPASGSEGGSAESLGLPLLERRICELAADISAATCRWLELVAEFDRRGGHVQAGFLSCSAWLAWSCSLTPRAAREQLRVARALSELPAIRAAFAAGRLSYSKARALSRVATPEIEEELVELAGQATAAQLERTVSGLRGALAGDRRAELARERRYLSLGWEEDGMLRVSGVLPAEEGEGLIKAIESAREALRRDGGVGKALGRRSEPGEAAQPDRADGLLALAESFLSRGPAAAPGGERNQVVVHVDLERLATGATEPDAAGAGSGGSVGSAGVVGQRTAQRLACDASLVTLIERAGEPVSVGRKTRAVPPAVYRALRARDHGCRFPGCTNDRYVDAHHIQHWAQGGETSVQNLVLLCRRHHTLVHEGGFRVERRSDGGLRFLRPNGSEVGKRPRLQPHRRLRPLRWPLPTGSGDALDRDHAVMVLAARAGPGD